MKPLFYYLILMSMAMVACKNQRATKPSTTDHGDFEISTNSPDTLYRFCGNELKLLPKNTEDQYSYFVRGAKLKANPDNPMVFLIEPFKEEITLHVIKNQVDTTYLTYATVNIPDPVLSQKSKGDSVDIEAIQPNKTIAKLLPNDCQYVFRYHGDLRSTLRFHKDEIPERMPAVFRKNYEGEPVPTRLDSGN